MNILNIETFLTIVETQSLSKASKKLFVSQSTISTRLNSLEKEINTTLLKRLPGKKTIELTSKGEEFVGIAKRWMALEKDTVSWINKEPLLNLNIGSVDSINIYVLTPLYKAITNSNSSLSINVTTHSSVQVFNSVETQDIDIGLASRSVRNNSLFIEPIFSEGMVLVSSPTYSNYDNVVHPQDLDVKNEIYLDWGPNFQIWHDYWWDPTEPIKFTVDTAGLILKFIDIPGAWAVVPITMAYEFKSTHHIKISELSMPPDDRIYYKVLHRTPRHSSLKPIKIFEEHLENFINENPYLKRV